jgi:uncharacterized protein
MFNLPAIGACRLLRVAKAGMVASSADVGRGLAHIMNTCKRNDHGRKGFSMEVRSADGGGSMIKDIPESLDSGQPELRATKSLVKNFLDRWSAGDVDGAFALCDLGGPWWPLSLRKATLLGDMPERYRSFVAAVAPEGVGFHISAMTAEGERVAVMASSEGVLVDGTPYENLYHFLFRIDRGRIAEIMEYCDTAYVRDVFARLRPGD